MLLPLTVRRGYIWTENKEFVKNANVDAIVMILNAPHVKRMKFVRHVIAK